MLPESSTGNVLSVRLPQIIGGPVIISFGVAGPLYIISHAAGLVLQAMICHKWEIRDAGILVLQEWGNRGERRILGYVESTAASSGVDHGDSHNTTEPSRLQPGVNAGLAFTAQDETALGAAPAEALPDGLGSDAWSSIAAEPSGDGIGSMSGQQGSQAWTTAAAPGPQGASGGSGSPEMGVEESAAWDSSISAGTSAAYSGKSMGAESLCDSLQGGPTEWMRHGGALGLACAQQVQAADYCAWCGMSLAVQAPPWDRVQNKCSVCLGSGQEQMQGLKRCH